MSGPGPILCLGTTPAVQRVMVFRRLLLDAVNRAVTTLDGAAGKSINVAKVLHTLGERPLATGFLGGDRGDFLRASLQERGIETDFVPVGTRTRQCVTVIDEAEGTVTELVEESRVVGSAPFGELLARIARHLPGCRAVVMSGTITPGGPVDLYRRVADLARARGLSAVVDAQGAPLIEALVAGPDLVKPNRTELAATAGRELTDEASVLNAMRELAERGARRVVVTAGAAATLAFDGSQFWQIIAPRMKALNPIGSGDAFTAAVTVRLLRGDDLGEACRWGAGAGTANAVTPMAGELDRRDVERFAAGTTVELLSGR
jgi:tagatose 6-phosphate kinase